MDPLQGSLESDDTRWNYTDTVWYGRRTVHVAPLQKATSVANNTYCQDVSHHEDPVFLLYSYPRWYYGRFSESKRMEVTIS